MNKLPVLAMEAESKRQKMIEVPGYGSMPKKEVKARASQILQTSKLGKLTGEHRKFMLALLKLHPRYEEKGGDRIRTIGIATWQQTSSRMFYAVRPEDTFSYQKCLGQTHSHWQQVQRAARQAVKEQTIEFKREAQRSPGVVWCEAEKTEILAADAHVDHVYPFVRLLGDWLSLVNITAADIQIRVGDEQDYYFVDERFRDSWFLYHERHCELQILSKQANLSKGRKIIPHTEEVSQK